ncbi:putative esterase [Synechococcus sp. PCC 7502]|uniref:YqiA/YcfP family alpha/beta fold hydrolase n=1 Tax=Synechococcus sp. PCC 7502 TaxID=1173263 RepID=UPI00029FFEA3|nr:YqiA/YcfP family alpha/beta fold hydrolase [Synechococcus sp. PCC 7502]AFY74028.1 putative esterase [Synechococcus sp. PCC 7502]
MNYLYLHGFASSPKSGKAIFLQEKFAQIGLALNVPDLNLGNFTEATLTKQLDFLQTEYGKAPLVVIGSSLGGYLALQMAIANPKVEKLILLAPAFKFSQCLERDLGADAITQWQTIGTREIYHYGLNQPLALKYEFLTDAQTYLPKSLDRELPIYIIHGDKDTVVLPELSQEFAANHPYATLEIVESDHSLGNVVDLIWERTKAFLELA